MDYSKFESLGDNCEFGFFLRAKSCEISSFFRWVVTPSHALVSFLSTEGEDLYKLDNLSRINGMVFDKHSGLSFHSKILHGLDNSFEDKQICEEQHTIYFAEASKLEFQRKKFFIQLRRDKKIYVVKRNSGLTLIEKDLIVRTLMKCAIYKESHIFFVEKTDDKSRVGSVNRYRNNVLIGYIGDFADYSSADHIQVDQWDMLTKEAYRIAFPEGDSVSSS